MNKKYYLALFSWETWDEFLDKGSSVYGTNLNKQSRMEMINCGDFLICYVTKLSCFVGLLEVTSKAYLDDQRIWRNDIYPVRVNVHPVYILEAVNGIPISELKEELEMFTNLRNPKNWSGFFINSLNTFKEHDAKIIVEKLKAALRQ
jgi:predicted RNA-binding protein